MKVFIISANRVRIPFPVYPLALDYLAGALQPMHTLRFLYMTNKVVARMYAKGYIGPLWEKLIP
jgi:hypothetical protein